MSQQKYMCEKIYIFDIDIYIYIYKVPMKETLCNFKLRSFWRSAFFQDQCNLEFPEPGCNKGCMLYIPTFAL
uniref:Uncharacterized protein n=1 Tax=Cannabis sativa TaxID=3483 RepID=A0A803RC67_CANSA